MDKEINLTVFERLLLRNIIPQMQGWNYGSMKQAREVMESCFTEEEEATLNIHQETEKEGKVRTIWAVRDAAGNDIPQEKKLTLSDGLYTKIVRFLENLNAREQLDWQQMTLYEKFTGGK